MTINWEIISYIINWELKSNDNDNDNDNDYYMRI